MSLGQFVREHRQLLGLTQEQLAERDPELSQRLISAVELGKVRPSPEKLRVFADALEISYVRLLLEANYLRESDEARTALGVSQEVVTDLIHIADDNPELMQSFFKLRDLFRALADLRDQNTREVYDRAVRAIARNLDTGISTANDVASPPQFLLFVLCVSARISAIAACSCATCARASASSCHSITAPPVHLRARSRLTRPRVVGGLY